MGWDATRPVPWKRFVREWVIYAVVFAAAMLLINRDDLRVSQFAWIVFSLPIWVGISALLAKFGYQRKTLKEARAESEARAAQQQAARAASSTGASAARPKPAPTRRTSTGPSTRPKGRRR